MEDRDAGLGWPMSTCHSLVPPALMQGLTKQTFSGLTLCGRSTTGCQGTWVSTYIRSQLLTSMWAATWIPVGYTRDAFNSESIDRFFLR